jgi:hypothetical protein
MIAMAVVALIGGALLGTRFNVWALLVCLGATTLLTSCAMLLVSFSLASTMITTAVVITSAQIGYLAGAYAMQASTLRRVARAASFPIDR